MALESDSSFNTRRKELLNFVKRLRAIGAQTDLDLPRVTVIGNQSAGKSSVVEAISRIHVPRDAGTCTRCPMECRMSFSPEEWTCQISIRTEFGADGKRLERITEDIFGPRISKDNKGEVELALRKAQYCALNPDVQRDTVIQMSATEFLEVTRNQDPLSFSRNIVCVDLQGPDLVDLSFIDLPGIIQNAEAHTVQLIENMVEDHISRNCIILVTLPMTDDIENQKALQLARKADPGGQRIIDVLTEPDMLTAGSSAAWRAPILRTLSCWTIRMHLSFFRKSIQETAPVLNPTPSQREDGANETDTLECIPVGKPFYLDDVRKHMQKSITRELPGNLPFSAKVSLIERFQDRWPAFVTACFNQIQTRFLRFLNGLIERSFKRHALLVTRLKLLVAE